MRTKTNRINLLIAAATTCVSFGGTSSVLASSSMFDSDGDDPMTPGCTKYWYTWSDCPSSVPPNDRVGDTCLGTTSLLEIYIAPKGYGSGCKNYSTTVPVEEATYNCNEVCVSHGHESGSCQQVDNYCNGVDSAKCVCYG